MTFSTICDGNKEAIMAVYEKMIVWENKFEFLQKDVRVRIFISKDRPRSIQQNKHVVLHWPGIEPGSPAWQARILPLNHKCLPVHDCS